MTEEYERIREKIAKWLWCQEAGYTWSEDAVDGYETRLAKESYGKKADQILALDGIDIRAKNQGLPDIEQIFADAIGLTKKEHKNVLGDKWKFIKPIVKSLEGFVKVIPKESIKEANPSD